MGKIFLLASFFSFISIGPVIASNGRIQGMITTSEGLPAAYVNVTLVGSGKGMVVDTSGHFLFTGVNPGLYTLRVRFLGLQPKDERVEVHAGQTAVVNVILNENWQHLKEVVIKASPNRYVTDYPSISLRLKTPLVEVPQNIQVISKQTLDDQQVFDMLEGVTRNVSGVTRMEHWDNYAQINMRGSQIAGFRNGMNVQSTWGPLTEDMSLVERIEFVKGPAGFMLANGEPSGFYNVVTKKPTGITKGEVGLTVGSFNTFRSTLDLDGRLSKDGKVLYRLNVMGSTKDAPRDYEYANRLSVAPVIKVQLTPHSSLTAEYTYQNLQTSPLGSNYAYSSRALGELPVTFTTAEANLDPTNIQDQSLLLTLSHTFNSSWKFTGQLAYLLYEQEGQTLWPTGFSANGDTLLRAVSNWDVLGQTKVGQFFLNGEFTTAGFNHRLLAGLDMGDKDYYHDWSQGGSIGPLTVYAPVYGQVPAGGYPVYDREPSIRERGVYYHNAYVALYLQDELRFLDDRLRVTLAGRYTSVADVDPYSGTGTAAKLTPRIGLSYSLDKNTSVYAVYDRAFVPQLGSDYFGKAFVPITGDNKEVGLKRDWLEGLWTASISGYQITKNNVLASDPDHPYFSIQLGQTQTKGLEFDLRGQVLPGLHMTANYAYTDGKITKNSDATVIGRQIAGTSKHIANAWLNYRLTDGVLSGFGLSAGVQYAAGRTNWYGTYDNSLQHMPDYTRVDGALSYQAERFQVALNVNNLLNTFLYSGAYYTYSNFYFWQAEPLRNTRLTITHRF
jgi:iron complex outermembrane receptor protein